jgi:hypothetical protein
MRHGTGNKGTYTISSTVFLGEYKEKVAGINWVSYYDSRDMLHKAKWDHLDRVHSDQMVLEMIRRGKLVLFMGGQESQN